MSQKQLLKHADTKIPGEHCIEAPEEGPSVWLWVTDDSQAKNHWLKPLAFVLILDQVILRQQSCLAESPLGLYSETL